MDSSLFTTAEKRFLLAEVIKSSGVDISVLTSFIQATNVSPNWMHMQRPHGRNMEQCIQVAEHLALPAASWDRQSTASLHEPSSSHVGGATASPDRLSSPAPSANKSNSFTSKPLARIAPRPTNGTVEDASCHQSTSSLPRTEMSSRKRGRSSRADIAMRALKPKPPQHIAPRPPHQMPGYVAILPATRRPNGADKIASPTETPATAQAPAEDDLRETKRRRNGGSES